MLPGGRRRTYKVYDVRITVFLYDTDPARRVTRAGKGLDYLQVDRDPSGLSEVPNIVGSVYATGLSAGRKYARSQPATIVTMSCHRNLLKEL